MKAKENKTNKKENKSRREQAMKTKNNVQKAILKSAAVIVSLVLISFTVNAQNFWKSLLENETFSQIAMAMVEYDSETNSASNTGSNYTDVDAYAEYTKIETEEILKVEDWMTNEVNFEAGYTVETEVPLELENWMTNENLFNVPATVFTVETETTMKVEDWMVAENVFDVKQETNKLYSANTIYKNLKEPKLGLENWMVNNTVWN